MGAVILSLCLFMSNITPKSYATDKVMSTTNNDVWSPTILRAPYVQNLEFSPQGTQQIFTYDFVRYSGTQVTIQYTGNTPMIYIGLVRIRLMEYDGNGFRYCDGYDYTINAGNSNNTVRLILPDSEYRPAGYRLTFQNLSTYVDTMQFVVQLPE